MADQVAVESHLRWCRTCALRVEDMRLIGASVRARRRRVRPAAEDATRAVAAISPSVLMRMRAEREQSFGVAAPRDVRGHAPAVAGARRDRGAASSASCVALSVLQAATDGAARIRWRR